MGTASLTVPWTIDRGAGWRQDAALRQTFDEEQAVARIVEIGILREAVEILDEPSPAPDIRIGRIKHRNGENVAISFDTLQDLMEVARKVRRNEHAVDSVDHEHREESFFPA